MPTTSLVFDFLALDSQAAASFDRMGKKTLALGSSSAATLKQVKALGLGIAVAGATAAVASIKLASQFQTSMTQLQTQAGASRAEVQRMSKAMLSLAGPTATAPDQLAKGLYHLESAGLRGSRAVEAMRVAAEGAKLGGADLESVTNALNAAIASGIPGVHNMNQAMGYLNATVGEGDMRMQDLADALGTGVLAIVKGFGVTMRDASAALAVFGDNNIRGAAAGTELRMVVQNLAKPAKTGVDVLKALGLQANTLAQDMQQGGLNQALRDLKRHMDNAGVSGKQVGQVITDAFGKKSSAPLSVLIGQMGRFDQKFRESQKAAHGFASSWTGYTHTFGYSFDRMRASVEVLAIKLGTVLLPAATKLANFITNNVLPAVQGMAHWFQRNWAVLGPLVKTLGEFLVAMKITSVILGVVGALRSFVGLAPAVEGAAAGESASLNGLRLGFIAVGLAAWQANNYTKQSNAQMTASLTATATASKAGLSQIEMKFLQTAQLIKGSMGDLENVVKSGFGQAVSAAGGDMQSLVAFAQAYGSQAASAYAHGFFSTWDALWRSQGKNAQAVTQGIGGTPINQGSYAFPIIKGHIVASPVHHAAQHVAQHTSTAISGALAGALGGGGGAVGGGVGTSGASKARSPVYHVLHHVGQLIAQGLIDGWTGMAGKLRDALSTSVHNALDHLQSVVLSALAKQKAAIQTAQKTLAALTSARKQMIQSVADSLKSDLSGAFQTDQFGNTALGNVGSYLAGQTSQLRVFVKDLQWAKAHGFSGASLQQIVGLGVAQGTAVLQQFMAGGTSVAAFNQYQKQIAALGGQAGAAVGDATYAKRIADQARDVHRQVEELRAIKQSLLRMERMAARDVVRHVTVQVDTHGRLKISQIDAQEIVAAINRLERTQGRKK
ncbi:MAG TPA: phage tail tape measure protein [Mycobacterium sp.]|nr:phage tail tape measure protein [Mycobacterium sp.]